MKSVLYDTHLQLGAKMIDYNGWEMPLHYSKGSISEHLTVRKNVGLFDLSFMGMITLRGNDAEQLLEYLSTNQIAGRPDSTVTYTLWASATGGCVNDLLVYRHDSAHFTLVTESNNRAKDLAHLEEYGRDLDVAFELKQQTGLLSVQGPHAPMLIALFFPGSARLQYMQFLSAQFAGQEILLSRTGYTGSVGYELLVPIEVMKPLWQELLREGAAYGIEAAGMGARDTLRLEMGYPHYGDELDETVAPTETVARWAVRWNKPDFLGREALEMLESTGVQRQQYGVLLQGRGLAHGGEEVYLGHETIGTVTSGGFSPILNQGIALIMIDIPLKVGQSVQLLLRDQRVEAIVTALPFIPIACKEIERVVRDRQFWSRGVKKLYFGAAKCADQTTIASFREAIVDAGYDILNSSEETEERVLEQLDQAECVVVDCSWEDIGLGRIIEYGKSKGLFGKKPAKLLCLYQSEHRDRLSPLIGGLGGGRYPHVQLLPYATPEEGVQLIGRFLEQTGGH